MRKKMAGGGVGGGKGGMATTTAPTDLLVCFPARQHLALMPKPIYSPSRTTVDKAVAARRRQLPAARGGSGGGGVGGGRGRGGSPLFRGSKGKQAVEVDDEPQSPKVTCVGQIKVARPKKPTKVAAKPGKGGGVGEGGRSWITVVEEIERLHEQRKKVSWFEAVGIRRDAVPFGPFLGGVFRSLRLKVRCFGSLHDDVESCTDDDDGVEKHEAESAGCGSSAAASVFSKWLMVLEAEGSEETPEQDSGDEEGHEQEDKHQGKGSDDECSNAPSAPPANALLLMRCRSAPAKGLARIRAEEPPAGDVVDDKGCAATIGDGAEVDGDELVFMRTAPDFLKLSIDIAKETWIVGGMDSLARSRSWKR
ncbi:hypothetical protein GUJ93_ZPchr0002g24556 [Zizania palustris]|uniref:Uncharacterized protein n=1 Tax=Zizania palustris TaxID=103762 RepID=A0A8J5RYV5_ZIZPA|nr:hypothetical protein GUJ93_ZPchr0002g24556 [Zizania palustris]